MRHLIITLLVILILLLLSLGGYAGYRFATEGTETPFSDTVLFVMALVGLLVALASLGIWWALRRMLQEDIERQISRREEATRNEALSRMAAKVADAFWAFYEDKQNIVFRDQAMRLTSDARNILEGRERVDKEELKCRIYNNLAFAYAVRGETKDTAIAHFLSNHAKERAKDFPDHEVSWLETYAYVLFKLPKKPDDKKNAVEIVEQLLQRPDIEDERKEKIRRRYNLNDIKAGQASNLDSK